MCGIFAMFLRRPLNEVDLTGARRVLSEIAHRGPNGQGEWMDIERGVFLGHRRLSIIDLSHASDQPIVRGEHAFIFNGELYNFQELRGDLEQVGVPFESSGDGEVLLRGVTHWGVKAFDRADGMFALADWDGRRALLAVDAFGEKPLFVAETAEGVYLCSEIDPLVRLLGLKPCLEKDGWAAYLSLGFIPQPKTFYAEVEMLPPGSWREVVNGRLGPINHYWKPPLAEPGRSTPQPIPNKKLDELVEALTESLERRLIADVPLTLFLSAGIDSALVAALCRCELNQEVHCLTVAFQKTDGMYDEAPAARHIANHLGFEHQIIDIETANVDAARLVNLLGQPNGTVGALPLEQISASARGAGFKVALTGMGGDEVTAGYAKHAYLWRLRRLFAVPHMLREPLGVAMCILGQRGVRVSSLLRASLPEVYLAVKNYPALDWLRSLPGYQDWVQHEFSSGMAPELAVPYYELTTVLPAVHLLTSDHSSMRHGLELRTPFLNRKVVEVIADWDPRALMAFGQKAVLRNILDRYLPRKLTDQPKVGFSFPRNHLVQRSAPIDLPGLEGYSESLWQRREEGGGWLNIAVRLAAAEDFFLARIENSQL